MLGHRTYIANPPASITQGCEVQWFQKRGGHKDLCAGLQAQQSKMAALGKHVVQGSTVPTQLCVSEVQRQEEVQLGREKGQHHQVLTAEPAVEHECPIIWTAQTMERGWGWALDSLCMRPALLRSVQPMVGSKRPT
jgi:hypothetical protein